MVGFGKIQVRFGNTQVMLGSSWRGLIGLWQQYFVEVQLLSQPFMLKVNEPLQSIGHAGRKSAVR